MLRKSLFLIFFVSQLINNGLCMPPTEIQQDIDRRQLVANNALWVCGGIVAADLLTYLTRFGYKQFIKKEDVSVMADLKTLKEVCSAITATINPSQSKQVLENACATIKKHKLLASIIVLTTIGEASALGTWGYQKLKILELKNKIDKSSQPLPKTVPSSQLVAIVTGEAPIIETDAEGVAWITGPNGKKYRAGKFSTPTIEELQKITLITEDGAKGTFRIILAPEEDESAYDVVQLQANPENCGATFLVASQFNCLESPSSLKVPHPKEYPNDKTQGPFASVGALPGTMLRYQEHIDVNTLGVFDGKEGRPLIPVRKGYINFATQDQVEAFSIEAFYTQANQVKIGIQEETQVVASNLDEKGNAHLAPEGQVINQVFASTIDLNPNLNYNHGHHGLAQKNKHNKTKMKQLAEALLTQQYKGAILTAAKSAHLQKSISGRPGRHKLFLTMLGAGAFRNSHKVIARAIAANEDLIEKSGLDVQLRLRYDWKPQGKAGAVLDGLAERLS
jgi:hypothetical protein